MTDLFRIRDVDGRRVRIDFTDGGIFIDPKRGELTAVERYWLDHVAFPELSDEWHKHQAIECSQRTQRRQAERKREREEALGSGEGDEVLHNAMPSKAAPELVEALYVFPPGWGPFGPRPAPKPRADMTHDEKMRMHFLHAANNAMFAAQEPGEER